MVTVKLWNRQLNQMFREIQREGEGRGRKYGYLSRTLRQPGFARSVRFQPVLHYRIHCKLRIGICGAHLDHINMLCSKGLILPCTSFFFSSPPKDYVLWQWRPKWWKQWQRSREERVFAVQDGIHRRYSIYYQNCFTLRKKLEGNSCDVNYTVS